VRLRSFAKFRRRISSITKDLFALTMRRWSDDFWVLLVRGESVSLSRMMFACCIFAASVAMAESKDPQRVNFLMSDASSLGFVRLYERSSFELNSAQCRVWVSRPHFQSPNATQDPESQIKCSVASRMKILLKRQTFGFGYSPIRSWGGADEKSFTVEGDFAQDLWNRLHKTVWSLAGENADPSIYYPIVSCEYRDLDSSIHACTELYTIDRKISGIERSQVLCARKTRLRAGASGEIARAESDVSAWVARQNLSAGIQHQVRSGDRPVEKHFCIFMD